MTPGWSRVTPGWPRSDSEVNPESTQNIKLLVSPRRFIWHFGVFGGWQSTRDQKVTLFRKHRPSIILTHIETHFKINTLFLSTPRVTLKLKRHSWISYFKSVKKLLAFNKMDKGCYMAELFADYANFTEHALNYLREFHPPFRCLLNGVWVAQLWHGH